MRTTITLDPDVEALVKRAMTERRVGFKEAVNDGLRRGLGSGSTQTDIVFPAYDMGTPFVDVLGANRVAEMLEDEALLQKLSEGR